MRFFNTVGPRQTSQYGMVLPTFVQQALAGRPITVYGDGRQVRCFTYVTDVVRATLALAESPQAVGGVFNVGGTEPISIGELARRVKALAKSDSPIEYVPYEVAYGDGFEDPQTRVPDIARLRATVGYEPETRLDDMIRRIIAYFRDQQHEPGRASEVPLARCGAPAVEDDACSGPSTR